MGVVVGSGVGAATESFASGESTSVPVSDSDESVSTGWEKGPI